MTTKRNLTACVRVCFNDMAAESHQDVVDALNQILTEMHDHCSAQIKDALEAVGAKDVTVDLRII